MRYILRRHLFFLIGFLTLDLFFLVAALNRAGKAELAAALAIPMRILIIPMYVFWLLAAMPIVALDKHVALSGLVRGILSGVSMVAGFARYVLADYIRARLRRTRIERAPLVRARDIASSLCTRSWCPRRDGPTAADTAASRR